MRNEADRPSNSRKFVKMIGGVAVSDAASMRGANPSVAREAPNPATNPRRERSALIRRLTDWMSGLQQAQLPTLLVS